MEPERGRRRRQLPPWRVERRILFLLLRCCRLFFFFYLLFYLFFYLFFFFFFFFFFYLFFFFFFFFFPLISGACWKLKCDSCSNKFRLHSRFSHIHSRRCFQLAEGGYSHTDGQCGESQKK